MLVVATGGLHADGLADCADGLGARGGGRERRLAVMRDPAIGVFGALALLAWGALLVGALARLGGADALRALVVAAAAGRWAALLHAATAAPARPDGLGAAFVVTPAAVALAAPVPLALAVVLEPALHGLAALLAGALVAGLVSLWARRMLGGRTGDTLGATVALGELAACLALVVTGGRVTGPIAVVRSGCHTPNRDASGRRERGNQRVAACGSGANRRQFAA